MNNNIFKVKLEQIFLSDIQKKHSTINYALTEAQPFHLVDNSPWPFVGSLAALGVTSGTVMYMHSTGAGGNMLFFSFVLVLLTMAWWWIDVVHEAEDGSHTSVVVNGLKMGMLLFIVSEVMFFFAFFWAFFHSSLSVDIVLGGVWPPVGISAFNPMDIPLLNTIILLSSGASVTWAHYAIQSGNKEESLLGLYVTIALAIIFTCFQALEYNESTFSMSDGVYGSTFFMATGFHGFHVIIGTLFLLVCLFRVRNDGLTKEHHFGFEAAAWYWHFVDVVWLFLFVSIYWWGGV